MQKWDVSSELTDQMETAGLEIQPDTLSLKMRKIFGLVLRLLLFSDRRKTTLTTSRHSRISITCIYWPA